MPSKEYLQSHAFLSMGVSPGSLNEAERTIDCLFYSGADVDRSDGWGNPYTLRFVAKGADLSLLNNSAPVLDSHSSFGVGAQLGKVERAWESGGKFYATLRFSKRKDPKVEGVWTDIRDGILSKFSMGVELLETVEDRDQAGKLVTRTATSWRPFELSLVSVPADFGTTTLQHGAGAPAADQAHSRSVEVDLARVTQAGPTPLQQRNNGIPPARRVEVDLAKLQQ